MSKVFNIQNFILLSFLLFACYPAFPNLAIRGIVVSLFTLSQFVVYFRTKPAAKQSWYFWLFAAHFLLCLLSLTYTDDLHEGWKNLERILTLFLIPLVLFLNRRLITKSLFEKVMTIYAGSCVILALYSSATVIFLAISRSESSYYFIRTTLENASAMHPTYFSLTVAIALLYIVTRLFIEGLPLKKRMLYAFSIFILAISLFIASSKMILLSTFIGLVFILSKYIKIQKLAIVLPVMIALIGIAVVTIKPLNERLSEFYHAISSTEIDKKNPDSIRKVIYRNSVSAIQDHLWFGAGIGDKSNVLNSYYLKDGQTKAYKSNYNTHSQYLETTLAAGILALFALLASLISSIYIGIKQKFTLLTAIGIMYALSFISEAILARQDGVFSYAFFTSFLVYYTWNEKKQSTTQLT